METEYQQPKPTVSMAQALSKYKLPVATTKARNRKQELIDLFKDRLNAERIGTQYKPLSYLAVQNKVAHLTLLDLEAFYKQCCEAKNFTKYFWWAIRP